ncbi:hypothetical protein H5410_062848 [Solanum commersonii]|uniref:Uncharacterized protein n=1 Tax=Solanum commersonii TaxID=4109 RepID=A0A9J5WBX1_SOLCO|nr:hypothetical protein H5410_062848 [Solanum commersonii]
MTYEKLVESKDHEEERMNRERYKMVRKKAKLSIMAAKRATFECWLEREMGGNLHQVKSIKDGDSKVLEKKTVKILEEWKWSTMIPLYKNKDGIQNCNNYRVWIHVGCSTTEVIHLVRRLVYRYKGRIKTYAKIPREILWSCLEARGVSTVYTRGSRTCMMESRLR